MKISTVLDHIESGHMALPEFQRGYVWNRDQVRQLFESLYNRHPVGGLLVWTTQSDTAVHRGDGPLAPGVVKLLLDGQQRMTSVFGVVRGQPPRFFDGPREPLTGLMFHLEEQKFQFWQPVKMRDDRLWIDVTRVFKLGDDVEALLPPPSSNEGGTTKLMAYMNRISRLRGILDIDLHVEEITGQDKSIATVVDIFNRVNSGGTKLSKGDLALAKVCADWPEARYVMKDHVRRWHDAGYDFNLDWLLRSVNTILTGEAKFQYLHDRSTHEVQAALERATLHIDTLLNLIAGRLGLDHDQVLFGRFAIPVMVTYLERFSTSFDAVTRDKLLFWFLQAGMWGRFSGSTETRIDEDLAALERQGDPLDNLLQQLRLSQGGLRIEAAHFEAWGRGARFYSVLYLLTRMGEARDWTSGIPLKANLLGKMNRLEVHHIFPKAQLQKAGVRMSLRNAIANFAFLTKGANLSISDRLPEEYFPEIEAAHPGALGSQWIPDDPNLWRIESYEAFLGARRELLSKAANHLLVTLLHGDTRWLDAQHVAAQPATSTTSPDEDDAEGLNEWIADLGLPRGQLAFELIDDDTGTPQAIFDLAWENGLQEGLTQPVALLLEAEPSVMTIANAAGYRCFADIDQFKAYVQKEVVPNGNAS